MSIDAELHQTIGAMKSTIDHLNDTVKSMMAMWGNQEKGASEGRRLVYEKVDLLKDSVVALGARVAAMEAKLTEIKPAVEEFKTQRNEQRGAMKLGKLMWTGMLAASGGMGAAIGWGFSHVFGTMPIPPPGH